MNWHTILRDGATQRGFDGGEGHPVLFQHGLGGDEAQVAEIIPSAGVRRLTLECRGHGQSQAGNPAHFTIAAFADDVLAFADARGVARFAVGGISMGAAIALRIAVKAPDRVAALVLVRPAWDWRTAPPNMQVFIELCGYLETGDRDGFEASASARRFADEAPDNLASLRNFFDKPDRPALTGLLKAIAADGSGVTEQEVRAIAVPTLVLGNAVDLVHPLALALDLAAMIAGSRFIELTPKARDRQRHAHEARAAIGEFLQREGYRK